MKRTTKKCSNCKGKGEIPYFDYDDERLVRNRAPLIESKRSCYRCNGTGKEKIE